MTISNAAYAYTPTAKALHWLIVMLLTARVVTAHQISLRSATDPAGAEETGFATKRYNPTLKYVLQASGQRTNFLSRYIVPGIVTR
jgi:hypothetical protein